jgi:hypothetical protein
MLEGFLFSTVPTWQWGEEKKGKRSLKGNEAEQNEKQMWKKRVASTHLSWIRLQQSLGAQRDLCRKEKKRVGSKKNNRHRRKYSTR